MTRQRLPDDRPSLTHKFRIDAPRGPLEGYITIGLYPAPVSQPPRPGEVFVVVANECAKHYPDVPGLIDDWAIALSVALQCGWAVCDAAEKFGDRSDLTGGKTAYAPIPAVSSLVSYVARYLAHRFCLGGEGTGSEGDEAHQAAVREVASVVRPSAPLIGYDAIQAAETPSPSTHGVVVDAVETFTACPTCGTPIPEGHAACPSCAAGAG